MGYNDIGYNNSVQRAAGLDFNDLIARNSSDLDYIRAKGFILTKDEKLSKEFKNKFINLDPKKEEYAKKLFLKIAQKMPAVLLQLLLSPVKFAITKDLAGMDNEKVYFVFTGDFNADLVRTTAAILSKRISALSLTSQYEEELSYYAKKDVGEFISKRYDFFNGDAGRIANAKLEQHPALMEKFWWCYPSNGKYIRTPNFFELESCEGNFNVEIDGNFYLMAACTMYFLNPQRLINKNKDLAGFLEKNIIPKFKNGNTVLG